MKKSWHGNNKLTEYPECKNVVRTTKVISLDHVDLQDSVQLAVGSRLETINSLLWLTFMGEDCCASENKWFVSCEPFDQENIFTVRHALVLHEVPQLANSSNQFLLLGGIYDVILVYRKPCFVREHGRCQFMDKT